MPLIIVTSS